VIQVRRAAARRPAEEDSITEAGRKSARRLPAGHDLPGDSGGPVASPRATQLRG
jgi:hypothetical protein